MREEKTPREYNAAKVRRRWVNKYVERERMSEAPEAAEGEIY